MCIMGERRYKELALSELIPVEGDAVTIINRGDHYEIVAVQYDVHPTLELTEADIEKLQAGEITWQ